MPPRNRPDPGRKILPVTGVGSYPAPAWFRSVLERRATGDVSQEELAESCRDAVAAVIREQEEAGLDMVTDGELARIARAPDPGRAMRETLGFIWGLLDRMEGVTFEGGPSGEAFRLTGELSAPDGLGLVSELQMARLHAARPVKIALPGPFSLALALADPEDGGAVESVLEQLQPILRRELEALAHYGAEDVQLDEPSLSTFMGIKPERWVRYFNSLVEGLPYRVHLHICFRSIAGGSRSVQRTYRPLIPYLNDLQVQVLHLEYSLNEMQELELLDEIAYDKQLAIGVVDAHDSKIESPTLVAERIRACMKHVDVRRLQVAPDCGLSSLPRAVARSKLESLSAGAALVRAELNRGRR